MRNSISEPKPLFSLPIIGLLALVLALSACGSGSEEVDAGSGGEEAETTEDSTADEGTDDDGADDGSSGGDYVITTSQPDMISPQAAAIEEVTTIDDQTIGVRFQNGSEPCSLANVTVTESDTEVTVALETGLHPNAAAMSCVAQVLGYEIEVALDAPVGDRTIILAEV